MKTHELFETLNTNMDKDLLFELPDGRTLSGDLHITEVKNVLVESVDCGTNEHFFKETIIQLWVNESAEKEAQWTTNKALKILNKVGAKKKYAPESDVFFEYGDTSLSTAKYSVKEFDTEAQTLTVKLFVMPTMCKPGVAGNYACC